MNTEAFSLSSTSPTHWSYIAEGGATIVFAYKGPPNDTFSNTVLRCRKATADEEDAEQDDKSVAFQTHVIEAVVSRQLLPHLRNINVDSAWMQELEHLTDLQRPQHRRERASLDCSRSKAVITDNAIGTTGWAAEIKVSWT